MPRSTVHANLFGFVNGQFRDEITGAAGKCIPHHTALNHDVFAAVILVSTSRCSHRSQLEPHHSVEQYFGTHMPAVSFLETHRCGSMPVPCTYTTRCCTHPPQLELHHGLGQVLWDALASCLSTTNPRVRLLPQCQYHVKVIRLSKICCFA